MTIQNVVHDSSFYGKGEPENNNNGPDELGTETYAMATDGVIAAAAFSLPLWVPYVEGWLGLFISVCTLILIIGRLIRLGLSFRNWVNVKRNRHGRN